MKTSALLLVAASLAFGRPAFAADDTPEIQLAALTLPPMIGVASWYGGHHVGRHTASGEIHSAKLRTAAHRNLPLGTMVRVTNLKNGQSALVKVNDRGPYIPGRIIDLSEQAARDLSMLADGLASVRLEVVEP